MIGLFETLVMKIPLVKSIYSASKQVVDSISMPSNSAFKAVVLVEWPKPGMYAVGFLTGNMAGPKGNNLYKVFIPTTPNPTSGFLNLLSPEDVIITTMKTEDAFKMIMSGGIISPESFEEAGEFKNDQGTETRELGAGAEKTVI
jgi:uncharacterized membrane protein